VNAFWVITSLGPPFLLITYAVYKSRESWLSASLWMGFAAGAGAAVVAMFAEPVVARLLGLAGHGMLADPVRAGMTGFMVAALPEELLKLVGLIAVIAVLDGRNLRSVLMIAVAVSMGFAGLENMLYLLKSGTHWQTVGVLRGSTAIPVHGVCALMMGAIVIGTLANDVNRVFGLLLAMAVPVALHGVYDSLLMFSPSTLLPWKTPVTVAAMFGGGLLAVALCNSAMQAAASFDGDTDVALPVRGFIRRIVVRASRYYLGMLFIPVALGGFNETATWNASFLAVLPAILVCDILFARARPRPSSEYIWQSRAA